jgi:hypothetical protein
VLGVAVVMRQGPSRGSSFAGQGVSHDPVALRSRATMSRYTSSRVSIGRPHVTSGCVRVREG